MGTAFAALGASRRRGRKLQQKRGGGWSRHLGNDKGMAQMAVLHMVWRSTSSGGLNPLVVDDFCPTWQNHVFAAEMQGQIPRLYLNVLGSSRAAPAVGDASITFTISDHRCISKFDTRKFDTGMFILTLVRCYFAKHLLCFVGRSCFQAPSIGRSPSLTSTGPPRLRGCNAASEVPQCLV